MKRRGMMSLIKSIFLVQLFVVIMLVGITSNFQQVSLPGTGQFSLQYLAPFSRIVIDENMALKMFLDSSFLPGEEKLLIFDPEYLDEIFPRTLLTASIQALAYTSPEEEESFIEFEDEAPPGEDIADETSEPVQPVAEMRGGKILLYCTHSAESYIPDEGKARVDGKRGLVNEVAQHLGKELRKDGMNSEFIDTIHDWPDYLISYTNSRNTIKGFLARNQSVAAVFDVHRDSIPGAKQGETVMINGKKCAPILIIVGTSERKPHPHWKKNLAFAQELYQTSEAKYPGLIKGVRTKAGTYNQEYHQRALLLEIGYDLNTLAEARYAAELFSDVLAEVMKQEGS